VNPGIQRQQPRRHTNHFKCLKFAGIYSLSYITKVCLGFFLDEWAHLTHNHYNMSKKPGGQGSACQCVSLFPSRQRKISCIALALNLAVSCLVVLSNRVSIVGTVTAYGLDDREVGVRVPVGSRIFCSPRLDQLWGPPSLLSNGYQELFPWR
jgi:hypothetical protein